MRHASLLLTVTIWTLNVRPVFADEDKEQFYKFLEVNISNILPTAFMPDKSFVIMTTSGESMQKWINQCISNPGDNPYRLVVHYIIRIGQTRNAEKLQNLITETQAFTQKNAKFFWANYVYLVNLIKAKDRERLKGQMQMTIRMEPEDAYGYIVLYQLGLVLEDYNFIDDLFKKATKKYPSVAIIFHQYGSFLQEYRKDMDGAARQYLKAIAINGYKDAYMDLAALYAAQDRYEEVMEVYNEALRKYPSDVHFLRSKGIMLVLMNKSSEGIPLIEEAVKIDPKDGKTYWLLGMAYKANGNKDKACSAFRKSVELGYEDAEKNLKEYCY